MNIAIIGAMAEEIKIIDAALQNQSTHNLHMTSYTSGTLGQHTVSLLQSGIGKVNAALYTALLINQVKPDLLINIGSAGALHPELKVGDVVIAEQLVYWDVDATAFGYTHGQVPDMPHYYEAAYEYINQLDNRSYDFEQRKGLIVSGDSFVSKAAHNDSIQQHFPDALAVDMESAAIAQTCHQLHTPVVVLRAMSDSADGDANQDFKQNLHIASQHSSRLAIDLIEVL